MAAIPPSWYPLSERGRSLVRPGRSVRAVDWRVLELDAAHLAGRRIPQPAAGTFGREALATSAKVWKWRLAVPPFAEYLYVWWAGERQASKSGTRVVTATITTTDVATSTLLDTVVVAYTQGETPVWADAILTAGNPAAATEQAEVDVAVSVVCTSADHSDLLSVGCVLLPLDLGTNI